MNTNPHQSLLDVPKDILFKVIEVCEPDSLYSMYLVNKSFQQIIEDMKLLLFRICSVKDPTTCNNSRRNLESFTNDFLGHHKFLQGIKHYKIEFWTYTELQERFNNPQLSPMINLLEIDTNIFRPIYNYRSMLEKVLCLPKIRMLSLINVTTIPRKFAQICSKNTFWRYLKLRDGTLSLFMDFSTCSFVNFSLDNMNCKSGTYIKMPHCLKECDLSCYLMEVELLSNYSIKFQMSHCKDLKTL
jgi:hypothetical protein